MCGLQRKLYDSTCFGQNHKKTHSAICYRNQTLGFVVIVYSLADPIYEK